MPLEFKPPAALTFGVELELMVLNTRDFNLTRAAPDLLARLEKAKLPCEVKPEITESMIEVNPRSTRATPACCDELRAVARRRSSSGGNAEPRRGRRRLAPFHQWSEPAHLPDDRASASVSALYGYLAKQFTVFGQHIHVGCAAATTRSISRTRWRATSRISSRSRLPRRSTRGGHLFDTSRLHAVFAFPLSGHMPYVATWHDFNGYFDEWPPRDRREHEGLLLGHPPKPEFGTIEIRICDTPLTVSAAGAWRPTRRPLPRTCWRNRRVEPVARQYLVYGYNRFQACRFGFRAPPTRGRMRTSGLREDISRRWSESLRPARKSPRRCVRAIGDDVDRGERRRVAGSAPRRLASSPTSCGAAERWRDDRRARSRAGRVEGARSK